MILQDLQTPYSEVVKKSYHLHWIGGLLLTWLIYLLAKFDNSYIFALGINTLFWFTKEMVWGLMEYLTRNGKRPYLKFLAWSKPDWRDFRFSVYGGVSITLLIYIYLQWKKQSQLR